jgi:hypothetical protein
MHEPLEALHDEVAMHALTGRAAGCWQGGRLEIISRK